MSTKRFWLLGALFLAFVLAIPAHAAGPNAMPGVVKVGSLEFTEAQLLMLAVYGFLLAIMLRRRIVG